MRKENHPLHHFGMVRELYVRVVLKVWARVKLQTNILYLDGLEVHRYKSSKTTVWNGGSFHYKPSKLKSFVFGITGLIT